MKNITFEDFCISREIKVFDLESFEIAVSLFLCGIGSEQFFPIESVKPHPTVQ